MLREWISRGWNYVNVAVRKTLVLVLRVSAASLPIFVVIPLLISFYIHLLLIGPIRVSIGQYVLNSGMAFSLILGFKDANILADKGGGARHASPQDNLRACYDGTGDGCQRAPRAGLLRQRRRRA